MRMITFGNRTAKEILRDPLNLCFGLGFPIVLLLLFSAIQSKIPVDLFVIESITPGMTVFGLSFMTLFSSILIAKDRESAFLQRLYTTTLTATDFIFGYALPIIPIAMAQSIICYIVAMMLGLKVTVNIIYAVLFIAPISIFFIALGLLCGSVFTSKQVGGICGALLSNLTAWLSGMFFDLDLVGGVFKKIAYLLPFVHAVELEKSVVSGNFADIFPHFLWVIGYAAVTIAVAVMLFLKQMKKQ